MSLFSTVVLKQRGLPDLPKEVESCDPSAPKPTTIVTTRSAGTEIATISTLTITPRNVGTDERNSTAAMVLSYPQIVGITVGVVVTLILVGAVVIFLIKRNKQQPPKSHLLHELHEKKETSNATVSDLERWEIKKEHFTIGLGCNDIHTLYI